LLNDLKISTPEMDLIEKLDEREEFGPLEDGYIYWFPSGQGAVCPWELRTIADELDKRNDTWHKQVMADLAEINALYNEAGMENEK